MSRWAIVRAALDVSDPIADALHQLISRIPASRESLSEEPKRRSEVIARVASVKAAAISGSLALPPGPAGLLTIIPDLYLIWRLQGQMVSDIAAAYGKTAFLTREGMVYCLFKHGAAQIVRELVVSSGQRLLLRRASLEAFQSILRRVGIHLSEQLASRTLSRWLPVIGSVGVGAFAFRDTARVARTAMDVCGAELSIDDPSDQAIA